MQPISGWTHDLGYVSSITAAAPRDGSRTAAICDGRVMTWSTLLDSAARIAGALRALGIAHGDRVAVLSLNSEKYLTLFLAIAWSGGVIVPLNSRWSAAENAFALDDSTPKVAFVGGAVDAAVTSLFEARDITVIDLDCAGRATWTPWSTLLAHDPVDDAGRRGNDLFGILYTGGTTGRSKGVMLSHAGFAGNCATMRAIGLMPDADRRMLVVAPLFHLAAIAMATVAMQAGAAVVIAPAFDPSATLDLMSREKVTDALLVPTMIQMMLNAPDFDARKLANVRSILYGASAIAEATLDGIMTAAPHVDFFQAYGMTEVSCTATILGPDLHRGEHRAAGRHRGAGRPMPGVMIRVVDGNACDVPEGEVGEVLVRGPGVMLGYWGQPELTAAAVRDGWMHTGDGGRFDDAGVLYIVDRMKDMIVSGGENVYSAEVEGAISLHPEVAQCAVIGVPDARWGERVHAVIVPRNNALTAEAVITHCRALIAAYKCPRSIEFRAALPLSPVGKILKTELRAPYWSGHTRNVA